MLDMEVIVRRQDQTRGEGIAGICQGRWSSRPQPAAVRRAWSVLRWQAREKPPLGAVARSSSMTSAAVHIRSFSVWGWGRAAARAGGRPHMPNSGRCEFVYLCARLYVINGRSDHQFNIVIRIGGTPNADYLVLSRCGHRGRVDYRSPCSVGSHNQLRAGAMPLPITAGRQANRRVERRDTDRPGTGRERYGAGCRIGTSAEARTTRQVKARRRVSPAGPTRPDRRLPSGVCGLPWRVR
jgi:hypothetical protein